MRLKAGGPAGWDSPEQDLLVLTDGHRLGRHGLRLAFRNAAVAEIDGQEPPQIDGTFETIVIERNDVTQDQLMRLVRAARTRLRPHGHLLLALGAGGPVDGTTGDAAGTDRPRTGTGDAPVGRWDDLGWCGVTLLDGRPFAVLAVTGAARGQADGPPATTTGASVAAATQVARALGTPAEIGQQEWARHLEAWHRSEQSLLDQLDRAVAAAENERARVADRRRSEQALREELARLRGQLEDHRRRQRSLQEQLAQARGQLNLVGAAKARLRRHRAGRVALRLGRYSRTLARRAGRRPTGG